ncbi:uncharacterized protein LOC120664717 [Panicum virgatum]|uniref:Hexosyltransferase n=1 Tax=Panicum virgatum TaxID=38727 RepID=A0A8T0U6M8_PANVG|nr:uncharacterized protein LOC120664717 [Panicum virgatum]KAG2617688.1 hypothetical protein PVAP13_3NG182996 [Panicum virgatum]
MSSSSSLFKQLSLTGAGSPLSGRHLLLILLGAGFLAFTVFVVHPNEFRIQSFFAGSCGRPSVPHAAAAASLGKAAASVPHAAATDDDVRVLIGIQTLPAKYERRHLLRTVYSLQVREHPSLAAWVAASDLARRERDGPEDMWTGRWFNLAGKARNRYDQAPRMYNYKGASPDSCFRHGFVPDTIAVHMLKDGARWAETLAYFNATAGLPRSGQLYHLPPPAGRP